MPGLSAVIITKNESSNIEACLRPLLQVADEVLVIDSHSTDNTRALATNLGGKVIETDWLGYSATKNFGNAQAANDWILSIDADERLSAELIQTLQAFTPEPGHVYLLDRFTNYCGTWVRYSGWYPDWKVRIFDRREVQWQGDFVHETLHLPAHLKKVRLSGKLEHYSYKTDQDHWDRMERYARLAAREMVEREKKISPLRPFLSAVGRFFRTFFLKSGWRDGTVGWKLSIRNAWLAYRKYHLARVYRHQPDQL
jgi:glycosyltransferase involved in cell wall biosynthesis